jgi:hypothetical protein
VNLIEKKKKDLVFQVFLQFYKVYNADFSFVLHFFIIFIFSIF